jgi:hypothetical protein
MVSSSKSTTELPAELASQQLTVATSRRLFCLAVCTWRGSRSRNKGEEKEPQKDLFQNMFILSFIYQIFIDSQL